jgi:CPA2 family monovalent cation:H+ antiporter-2
LAPWDAHIVNFTVDANFTMALVKHLLELGWREEFGINIARIFRGDKIINTRLARYERIFPSDKLIHYWYRRAINAV